MQVCVYPVPAISGIRPGTAGTGVERRMQVCVYPVPAISRIRPGTAVERRNAGLCLPGPGDFKDSSGSRCGA